MACGLRSAVARCRPASDWTGIYVVKATLKTLGYVIAIVALAALLFIALFMFAGSPGDAHSEQASPPVRPVAPCSTVPASAWNKQLRAKRRYTGRLDRKKIATAPVCKRKYANLKGQVRTLKRRESKRLETDPHYAIPKAFRDEGIGWRIDEAMRVARCESTFNRRATNGIYRGLYQLSPHHQSHLKYGPWYHAYSNARRAAEIVRQDGGWHQWECRP